MWKACMVVSAVDVEKGGGWCRMQRISECAVDMRSMPASTKYSGQK